MPVLFIWTEEKALIFEMDEVYKGGKRNISENYKGKIGKWNNFHSIWKEGLRTRQGFGEIITSWLSIFFYQCQINFSTYLISISI